MISQAAAQLKQVALKSTIGLVGREELVDLVLLGAVAHEHVLIIGPPGTAKSAAIRSVSKSLGGQYFEYLLGRFTEPSELFGPINIKSLQEGVLETETSGMLPEADIAFLDEIFLGSTAILNTLLGILNERQYRRGNTHLDCPLRICVGASNQLPDDETLAAFADRFLIHTFVEPVEDHNLESLLRAGWQYEHDEESSPLGFSELDQLCEAANRCSMDGVYEDMAQGIRLLRNAGVHLSDRRIVKAQKLVAAAACLDGREEPTSADLWPLVYVVPTEEGQQQAKDALQDFLVEAKNKTLSAAVEAATLSPAARAARICEKGKLLLDNPNADGLALEALGREIDANFPADKIDGDLKILKDQLIKRIENAVYE